MTLFRKPKPADQYVRGLGHDVDVHLRMRLLVLVGHTPHPVADSGDVDFSPEPVREIAGVRLPMFSLLR
jgi:hypothetical protein